MANYIHVLDNFRGRSRGGGFECTSNDVYRSHTDMQVHEQAELDKHALEKDHT